MSSSSHRSHKHSHTSSTEVDSSNLFIALIINLGITIIQFIGGILSGSLSLISDAVHNLGDSISLFSSYLANKIGKRQSNLQNTFGYKRIEVLAALFNSFVLIGVSVVILYEAVHRLQKPTVIDFNSMIALGVIGLLGNLFSAYILHKDAKKSINVKSSYYHLIGDSLTSLSVIVCAFLIKRFDVTILDTLLSIGIAAFILFGAYKIIKETVDILMQSAPKNVNIPKMREELEALPVISNIHHLHIWRLSDNRWHFECHVDLKEDLKTSETYALKQEMKKIIKEKYKFTHVGLQMEFGECKEKSLISDCCK
ncbi:MAG: cation diffusion facilitator family transporter [Bacteroidota bacterium]